MKQFLLSLLFLAGAWSASAQISVLFVDDTDDSFNNAENFAAALSNLGTDYTYFNAVDSAAAPTLDVMENYDLVIWHAAADPADLLLWNGIDEDNGQLEAYLDNGGNLWLVGNDFLDDRYGGASGVTFEAGDFPFDYLGIASWDVESYEDDAGEGVPQVEPAADSPVSGLDILTWQFSTLWYVDGVTPLPTTQAVYVMGDENYLFADEIAATYYSNGFRVLTYYFDLSLTASASMLQDNVESVLAFFESTILNTKGVTATGPALEVAPNPTAGPVSIRWEQAEAGSVQIRLVDVTGRFVAEVARQQQVMAGSQELIWSPDVQLTNGMYWLQVQTDTGLSVQPLVIQR
jgi:hypothetical protein